MFKRVKKYISIFFHVYKNICIGLIFLSVIRQKKLAEFPKLISYSIKELTYACTASVYRSRAVAS